MAMKKWTEAELAAAVEAYREMEARFASGQDIGKAQMYRELAALHGRSAKAWEYRMQNISHVLDQASEPWLPGLRPAANVGAKVEAQLAELLNSASVAPTALYALTKGQLDKQCTAAAADDKFSIVDDQDQRNRVLAAIVLRRGQPAFRRTLLRAYSSRCAVTGCDVPDALDAAHIRPYSGRSSNAVSNGLLLRGDVHTLFDLYLVTVEPESFRISIAPELRRSSYGELEGKCLARPTSESMAASADSLAWHRSQRTWE